MRHLKQILEKHGSTAALLRFLSRPFDTLRNQITDANTNERKLSVKSPEEQIVSRFREAYFTEQQIEGLRQLFASKATRRLVFGYEAAGDMVALRQLAQAMQLVQALEQSVFRLTLEYQDHCWINRFPHSLHSSLTLLGEAAEDAERIAGKMLFHDVPNHAKLTQERDYLLRKLEQGDVLPERRIAFARRAEDIEHTLSKPPELTPERTKNLHEKIANRATLECQKTLNRQIRAAISRGLAPHGIDVTNSPINDSLLVLLVQSIHWLQGKIPSQGWRLLKHVLQGTELRWEEDAENREFIEGLDRDGINTKPWLDRDRRLVVKVPTGEELVLQFTRNALDYLLMGHHFATCLAPGDDNFYSTIANALDVNKQVLYARTRDGNIVGRCLITLGTGRQLLVYQAYAHRWYGEFCAAVKEFTEALAREMNVRLENYGEVESLVVEEWYDDEPIDIRKEGSKSVVKESVKVTPPPASARGQSLAGRLGAIDLSSASSDFLVTLAADYH